jgi:hypothetical protein
MHRLFVLASSKIDHSRPQKQLAARQTAFHQPIVRPGFHPVNAQSSLSALHTLASEIYPLLEPPDPSARLGRNRLPGLRQHRSDIPGGKTFPHTLQDKYALPKQ